MVGLVAYIAVDNATVFLRRRAADLTESTIQALPAFMKPL